MKSNKIPVLLSFTATLDAVASGDLSDEDLDRAIYAFGCRRRFLTQSPAIIMDVQRPYQKLEITPEIVLKLCKKAMIAEGQGRLVWRRDFEEDPSEGISKLNEVLHHAGLKSVNYNLPPAIFNDTNALRTAIERVSNVHSVERVVVITSDTSV